MPKSSAPNFIIIGAMKSATSTLHNQLAAQPGIFMSTPKEPNFFSDDAVYAQGLAWYHGLFREAAETDLCGESSTHYTKLPDCPHTIERLQEAVQSPRLIYVMRDPIDRLISHYIHQWSEGIISCDINQAIDRYPELINYSCYGMQIKPYLETFGKDAVLPVFFDALKSAPDQTLVKVGEFIGCPAPLSWVHDLGPDNVSQRRVRKFLGYKLLIESPVMQALRRRLIPQRLRDSIKGKLQMQARPKIHEAQLERISSIFDRDLHTLSPWLGFEITCANFRQVSLTSSEIKD